MQPNNYKDDGTEDGGERIFKSLNVRSATMDSKIEGGWRISKEPKCEKCNNGSEKRRLMKNLKRV